MGIKQVRVATCDHCLEVIDLKGTIWIDAGVYGICLHDDCWTEIGGPRVARVLELDDISREFPSGSTEKAWGPR